MIGLLGAKIWKENGVDFGNPINLVPVAAGIIIAIGNTTLVISKDFQLSGIAFGTIVTIVAYHLVRLIAPPHLREQQRGEGAVVVVDRPGAYVENAVDDRVPADYRAPADEALPAGERVPAGDRMAGDRTAADEPDDRPSTGR
jgi:membrane protein implicated in regulation of membrane protease activity